MRLEERRVEWDWGAGGLPSVEIVVDAMEGAATVAADGSHEQRLTDTPEYESAPSWASR